MNLRLPEIYSADQLLDISFRQASKKAKALRSTPAPKEKRIRESEKKRVETASKIIEKNLLSITKNFPSYEQLPPFYQKLLEIKINKDRYKKSLGAAQWALKNVQKVKNETIKEITGEDTRAAIEFLGRTASIIKKIKKELDDLSEIRKILLEFPVVEDLPTIVVAGYPNVGKSTFMKTLTGSNVKIAPYPFTTKDILVGHKKTKYVKYQILDSPGLLDRPKEERNQIEMQSIIAIKELADAVLFIIDPNQEITPQKKLLEELKQEFTTPIYVALNKADTTPKEKFEEIKKQINCDAHIIAARNPIDCEKIFNEIASKINQP